MPRKKSQSTETVVAPPEPPKMALRFTHTRLLVENMDVCYKFYRDTLELKPKFDGEGSVYAEFDAGNGHTLALFSRELMHKAIGSTFGANRGGGDDSVVIAFEVPNVDAVCEMLQKKGVTFSCQPCDQKEWMLRVAHFRDPDGHLLEINAGLQSPAE